MEFKEEIINKLFLCSPLLKKYFYELEANWDEVLQDLEENLKSSFFDSVSSYKPNSMIQFIIFFYFLYSGCIYLIINYDEMTYIELGKKVKILENPLLKQSKFQWNTLDIYAIFPLKSEKIIQEIFKKEFFPFIRKIILNDAIFLQTNFYDYIQNTIDFIDNKSKSYLEKGIPVTLTHFKFENLWKYLKDLGNLGIYNFILEIDSYIRSRLKKRDILVILSCDSYLVMSVGARKEIIFERFKNIYIEIKNLVLDYHLYIENLLTPEDSIKEIVQKLNI